MIYGTGTETGKGDNQVGCLVSTSTSTCLENWRYILCKDSWM